MSKIKPIYNDILLNTVIVSDTHIDIKHPFPFVPKNLLKKTLSQSQSSKVKMDAYITVGDTTSRGSDINWKMTKECFCKFKPADEVILTVGNHDLWNDNGFDAALSNYINNFNDICSFRIDKPYFSKIIKGYYFIFLGNDDDAGCEANISDQQFDWFAKELKSASEIDKPVFIFCHQSLNGKHGLPRTWDKEEKPDRPFDEGGIGDRSDEIENEMKKYKNVFYFSGHSHMGLAGEKMKKSEGYSSVENDDGVTLVNLPSLACGNHHGDVNSLGMGLVMEVYAGKVVLRFRNFKNKKWNNKVIMSDNSFDYTISLV